MRKQPSIHTVSDRICDKSCHSWGLDACCVTNQWKLLSLTVPNMPIILRIYNNCLRAWCECGHGGGGGAEKKQTSLRLLLAWRHCRSWRGWIHFGMSNMHWAKIWESSRVLWTEMGLRWQQTYFFRPRELRRRWRTEGTPLARPRRWILLSIHSNTAVNLIRISTLCLIMSIRTRVWRPPKSK